MTQTFRIVAAGILGQVHDDELDEAIGLQRRYLLGNFDRGDDGPTASWKKPSLEQDRLVLGSYAGPVRARLEVPFIFEDYNADHIKSLRERHELEKLISDSNKEYEEKLKVASWSTRLWDHGMDMPPGGPKSFKAIDAIEAAKKGARYWCEISARATSQIASSLGWPSRVITLSRTGYDWEHAVAELWSNQLSKWFVVDTDFGVIYESNGIPLSAFELVNEGKELKRLGRLEVKELARLKPFFLQRRGEMREKEALEQLAFYNYAHVDMRNDWASRTLSRGSPVGGDRATYYTSNELIPPVLTAARRAVHKSDFDWPVNLVEIHLAGVHAGDSTVEVEIELKAYGPYADHIEIQMDGGAWETVEAGSRVLEVSGGIHHLHGRLALINDGKGPTTKVTFRTGPSKE